MKKVVIYVDEDTLELKKVIAEDNTTDEDLDNMLQKALNCEPYEFEKKYEDYKKAEAAFNAIYEPFKKNLIKLHEEKPNLPKSIIIGGVRCTYVSPSKKSSIDTKKLKEEEPEIAKKYMKTTDVKANVRIENPILKTL